MGKESTPTTLSAWIDEFGSDFGFEPWRRTEPTDLDYGDRRVEVLARRIENGEPLFVKGDSGARKQREMTVECAPRVKWTGSREFGIESSECGRYRYRIWKRWRVSEKPGRDRRVSEESMVVPTFILFRPNPTDTSGKVGSELREIEKACKVKGYAGYQAVYAFGLLASSASEFELADDPIGPANDRILLRTAVSSGLIVCAWGRGAAYMDRSASIAHALLRLRSKDKRDGKARKCFCWGMTRYEPFTEREMYFESDGGNSFLVSGREFPERFVGCHVKIDGESSAITRIERLDECVRVFVKDRMGVSGHGEIVRDIGYPVRPLHSTSILMEDPIEMLIEMPFENMVLDYDD